MLANIVGTTRPRIHVFMKQLKKRGFMDTTNGLPVHQTRINILLRDYIPGTR